MKNYYFKKYGRLFIAWLWMAVFAVFNGVFREIFLIGVMGEYPAHVSSTFLLVGVILAVSYYVFVKSDEFFSVKELVFTGVSWSMMTVGFEFLVAFVENTPFREVFRQYNVLSGQVWILVPVTLLVSPWFFGHFLRKRG